MGPSRSTATARKPAGSDREAKNMKKHASSHALAVLVCTVTAGVLIEIGRDHYPLAAQRLGKISRRIVDFFGLDFEPKIISILILAILLAAIWGIAFSFMHSDNKEGTS
jgi:hypothetical protein